MYKVPNEFYFRIHHIRPRFKNDAENVLVFMAAELMELGIQETVEFKQLFNNRIRRYPGNQTKAEKTISNWRTEISSFFGFVQKDNGNSYAGLRAQELADKQDMI
ncbi:MAG: restriction endonuclease, partial [bacterium]